MIRTENIKKNMKVISRLHGIGHVISFRISDTNRAYALIQFEEDIFEQPLSQLAEIRDTD